MINYGKRVYTLFSHVNYANVYLQATVSPGITNEHKR